MNPGWQNVIYDGSFGENWIFSNCSFCWPADHCVCLYKYKAVQIIFFRAYPIFLSILKNEGILLPCSSNLAWTCVLSWPFSKSLVGARSSGSHPIFCPGMCILLALLKIFCGSQRSWLPPNILSWTSLSHLPCKKIFGGSQMFWLPLKILTWLHR